MFSMILNRYKNTLVTALKLSVVFIILGLPAALFAIHVYDAPPGEAATYAAVPLMVVYVMWRTLRIFFAPGDKIEIRISGGAPEVISIALALLNTAVAVSGCI